MITTTEAAALLSTALRNVQNYCKRHQIVRHGRDYLIPEAEIERMRAELGKVGRKKRDQAKPPECGRRLNTMTIYETRDVGMKGETDVVVKTGITTTIDGWNMTHEQVAQHPFLVGRISQRRVGYHVVSYAQQSFQRSDWRRNNWIDVATYDEALGWIKSECNNVLERL